MARPGALRVGFSPMHLEDAFSGRTYRFKEEGSNDPWCEGVLVRTYRNDEGELRGDFRYFAGSPRLPEDAGPLELEPIGIPNL
jgi:hypothetical protein